MGVDFVAMVLAEVEIVAAAAVELVAVVLALNDLTTLMHPCFVSPTPSQLVIHDWYTKCCGMCCSDCGEMLIKYQMFDMLV